MDKFFYPKSVMVVGVSEDQGNMARNIVRNLLDFEYYGPIYPVGPRGGVFCGQNIYTSIAEVPGTPDLAVFLIPAKAIPAAFEQCGRKGIRHAIIESGGFSEFSEDNLSLEQELLQVADKFGIKFVGPNCISIINTENGLALPFVRLDKEIITNGKISVIAQSGGVIVSCINLFSCENLGFNKLISIGNKLNLNENDYLEYLIKDPGTEIIGLYLESISDGRRLIDLASRTTKPIVVYKANIGKSSQSIAKFHTSAIAGDARVAAAAFRQAGISQVENLRDFIACFKVFSLPPMQGPGFAILSRSGGHAVMAADAADQYGFNLVPFTDRFLDEVQSHFRAKVIRPTNPLDLGDLFDFETYIKIVENVLKEDHVHGLLFQHVYVSRLETAQTRDMLKVISQLADRYHKPVAFCLFADEKEMPVVKNTADYPVFNEPEEAVKALSVSWDHFRFLSKRKAPGPAEFKSYSSPATSRHEKEEERPVAMNEVMTLLDKAGIRVAPTVTTTTPDQAIAAAGSIGFPVALKLDVPGLSHKSDQGGVILNLQNDRELLEAWPRISVRLEDFRAGGAARGIIVQRMVPGGKEIILAGKRDEVFGPVIMFGLGGVLVEVMGEVVFRVAPVSREEAIEMINEIRAGKILSGLRGESPGDIDALAAAITAMSDIMRNNPDISIIEINPLVVLAKGAGVAAVDARMMVFSGPHASRNRPGN
ncbi:MAG: acetate--CoA ligase family protein [Deltaproteobacteria bacterium]|nr:acetate--CoA ligase family protein [Deltaproteobacteria bacterium]